MIHDVLVMDLLAVEEEELKKASQTIACHEKQEERLRAYLEHALPLLGKSSLPRLPGSPSESAVNRMLDYIHANYGRPITLKQLAGELQMNASYLSDLFAKTMGRPFKEYLLEFRYQKALQLLQNPGLAMPEVAHAVGYSDPNYFRRIFKEHAGI